MTDSRTSDQDVSRAIRSWLHEDRHEDVARIAGAVLDQVEATPQRRSTWWPARRLPTMNNFVKLGLAAVAVLVAALVGIRFLPGDGTGGPSAPTPDQSTPAPTTEPQAFSGGGLAPGAYVAHPFGSNPTITVEFTVPTGWEGIPGWAVVPQSTIGGGMGVGFLMPDGVFSDPCRWDQLGTGHWPQVGDIAVGPTAEDLATALASNPNYEATDPVDVELGGFSGMRVDLQLPSDVDFASCDRATGRESGSYFVWGTSDPLGTNLFAQGPGNRWHLWILDVNEDRVVIFGQDFADTAPADVAEWQSIVESVRITAEP
jgi:hypothetical protein